MPRPRFNNIAAAKREAILDAAAREFAQVGYEAASINRILDSAGLSKGAFYYYFDDKADLACTVLLWAYGDMLNLYKKMSAPDDPSRFWEAVHDYARQGLELMKRAPYSNELISRLTQALVNDKELNERVVAVVAEPIRVLASLWKRGQEIGAVRTDIPSHTLIAILQGIKEALLRSALADGRALTNEEFEALGDLQLDLFRRVSEPAREPRT